MLRLTSKWAALAASTLACQAPPTVEGSAELLLGTSHAALTAAALPAGASHAGPQGCADHADDDSIDARERASHAVHWRHTRHPGAPGVVPVRLLGLNDFHGRLSEGLLVAGRPVGGAAVLASYLKASA